MKHIKTLLSLMFLATILFTTGCSKKEEGDINLYFSANKSTIYSGDEVVFTVDVYNTFPSTSAILNIVAWADGELLYSEDENIYGANYKDSYSFTFTAGYSSYGYTNFDVTATVVNSDRRGDQKTVTIKVRN